VTVMVIGLFAVPLATQVAYWPCALHEPIVPALATVAVATSPPTAKNPVIATPAAIRRNLFKPLILSAYAGVPHKYGRTNAGTGLHPCCLAFHRCVRLTRAVGLGRRSITHAGRGRTRIRAGQLLRKIVRARGRRIFRAVWPAAAG